MNASDSRPDTLTIAAAAVGAAFLAVAVVSLFLMGRPSSIEAPDPVIAPTEMGVGVPEGFTDPRGPERGPTPLEWEVIRVYKVIENMTADEPPVAEVDRALERLQRYTDEHPGNPFIHETYLKGLRVSAYYADLSADPARVLSLHQRFVAHAAEWQHMEHVVIESMWYRLARLEADCANRVAEVAELERLLVLVPEDDKANDAFLRGLQATVSGKCALTPAEHQFWSDRLIQESRKRAESSGGRWFLRVGLDQQFHRLLGAGELDAAELLLEELAPLTAEHPGEFATTYANGLRLLSERYRADGQPDRADDARERLLRLGDRYPEDEAVQRLVRTAG